jgi:hypothetical protein
MMHMLSAEGCTPQERKYRGQRHFAMLCFIALHERDFSKAGFVLIHDGVVGPIPFAILRAVHETFRTEPLRNPDTEPVQPVIERAKTYGIGTWQYE